MHLPIAVPPVYLHRINFQLPYTFQYRLFKVYSSRGSRTRKIFPFQIILKLKLSHCFREQGGGRENSNNNSESCESSNPPSLFPFTNSTLPLPPIVSIILRFLQIRPSSHSTSRDRGRPFERRIACGGRQRAEAVVAWVAARGYPSQPTEESRSLSGGATRSTVLNQRSSFLQSEREAGRERCDRLAFHARFSSSRRHRLLLFPRSFVRSFLRSFSIRVKICLGPEGLASRFIGQKRREREGQGGWRRIITRWRRGGIYLHSTYNIFEQQLQGDKVPCCSLATVNATLDLREIGDGIRRITWSRFVWMEYMKYCTNGVEIFSSRFFILLLRMFESSWEQSVVFQFLLIHKEWLTIFLIIVLNKKREIYFIIDILTLSDFPIKQLQSII